MKKSINFILFLLVFLFASGSNVLAADHSGIIPITGDKRAHFEIHPEVYKRWAQGKEVSTDQKVIYPLFDESRLRMSGKKIPDDDQNFKEFREKHKDEAAFNKADAPQWNAYELDLMQNVGYAVYGNFDINSSGIDDGSMYNIWPEQVEMYLSYFDKSTNSWSEPKKLDKRRGYDDQGKGFLVIQDYKSSHDGRKYSIDLSLQPVDYYQSTHDKFRIYIFQGWPKPIPKDLLPGTYNIPLSIRYSNSPGKYSMADGAVGDNGKLIVGQDGSIKLRIKFNAMTLSDPAYTGGKPITGHLMKLWTYNSVNDFDQYMKAPTVFTAREIDLDNPQYLKKYYSEEVDGIELSFPEIYEIPLKYENGSTNYESQKLFKVKVDAMGNSLQNFNLLMRWEDMKLEKLDLQSGKYKALQIISLPANQATLDTLWDKENNKLKYTKEQYIDELFKGNYKSLRFDPGKSIIPIYDLEIKKNKADITVYWAEQYKKEKKIRETGIVKIDDSKPIQYKSSDGSIKDAEVLESKDFTVTNKKNTYKNRITKIKLKDVPLSIGDEDEYGDEKIGLINARFISVEDNGRMTLAPKKTEDPVERMFKIPNYDIWKKVLVEKIEEINKDKLNQAIEDAKSIKIGKHSGEDFNKLTKAIESAENVAKNETENQNNVNEALKALNKAIEEFTNSKIENPKQVESLEVPVMLWHAYQDNPSMGNGALVQKAKIEEENGKTYMTIKLKGLDFMSMRGHLLQFWTYKENDFNSDKIESTIIENKRDKGLGNEEKEFPSLFKFEIDPKFKTQDGEIYCRVRVDAMEKLGGAEQNAKLKIMGSKAKKWTGWGDENQSNPSNPSNPSTPGYSFQNFAIERSALGSAMASASASMSKGADSNLVAAMARAGAIANNPYASREEILSATQALNNAVINNKGSMNNQNNNNSWGNNNQGWGNNSGWGNNNSSWGSYGNNNQGWNNNSSWGVYNNNQNNNKNNGPVTIQYEVPVEVLHAYQDGYSMANGAINHIARVEERNGQFRYSVQFNPLEREFNGQKLVGNLTHLFIHDGNKYLAEQSSGNVWSWVMNGKYNRVNISVKVDVMDQIAVNEQKAILSFNWNAAREVGRVGGNNNNQNQQNQNQQNQQNQQKQAPQVVQNNSASNNFTDTSGHWAKTAIDYVVSKGYFAGLSNTEFGPNKSITRGQFVSVLGRMLKVNVNDYKDQNFKDVKSGMYYSPYITWANKVGIVSGVGQGNFAPDKELTREEMAVMMTKFLKVSGKNLNAKGNTNSFKDEEKIQGWAKDSVKEMARLGIVSGMGDGSFAPKSQFTRAQVAQVLYNIDHN
ncbi:S-layer homology domain-containing protein [Peptoniphilus vaginalis]|uniref:S-layer homology domain-containing protein n=1 Tax=Peptoniphilus vaginalis TaxID=1756987 RepID=UPI000A26E7E6|nr:S-layer homology domain-containing protein [Peptoniphilus vaginalis]